jgi:hypothetical protein
MRVAELAATVSVVEPLTPSSEAWIVAEPVPTDVASPFEPATLLIAATLVRPELQVTVVVMFWVLRSLYAPVAVNCCVAPSWIDGFAGVMAIEINVGATALTVRVVVPLTGPNAACIVDDPTATLVARPETEIVATEGFEELQVTEFVMVCIEPSLYVPVAVNCCVAPVAIVALAGETASEANCG